MSFTLSKVAERLLKHINQQGVVNAEELKWINKNGIPDDTQHLHHTTITHALEELETHDLIISKTYGRTRRTLYYSTKITKAKT